MSDPNDPKAEARRLVQEILDESAVCFVLLADRLRFWRTVNRETAVRLRALERAVQRPPKT